MSGAGRKRQQPGHTFAATVHHYCATANCNSCSTTRLISAAEETSSLYWCIARASGDHVERARQQRPTSTMIKQKHSSWILLVLCIAGTSALGQQQLQKTAPPKPAPAAPTKPAAGSSGSRVLPSYASTKFAEGCSAPSEWSAGSSTQQQQQRASGSTNRCNCFTQRPSTAPVSSSSPAVGLQCTHGVLIKP